MEKFEQATRLKLRFKTGLVGDVTTEDLWDIPLLKDGVCLDNIAKLLSKQIKQNEDESFVLDVTPTDAIATLKLDVVKHVIEHKKEMAVRSKKSADTKAKNQRIMEIIANKQDSELTEMSVDELKKLMTTE